MDELLHAHTMEDLSAWDQGINFIDETLSGYGVQRLQTGDLLDATPSFNTADLGTHNTLGEYSVRPVSTGDLVDTTTSLNVAAQAEEDIGNSTRHDSFSRYGVQPLYSADLDLVDRTTPFNMAQAKESIADTRLAGFGVQPPRYDGDIVCASAALQTHESVANKEPVLNMGDGYTDLDELQHRIQHLEHRRELAKTKTHKLRLRVMENAEKISKCREEAGARSSAMENAQSVFETSASFDHSDAMGSPDSSCSSHSGSPRGSVAQDFLAMSSEAKASPNSRVAALRLATARQDNLDSSVQSFWQKYPKAVEMLENVVEVWTGEKGLAGARLAGQRSRECASALATGSKDEVVPGGPCDERDTLWARVLFGQEAKIRWLLKDNAVRRQQISLQERLPEMDACSATQRELRTLHGDSSAQQDLIGQLFSAPPSFSPSELEAQVESEMRTSVRSASSPTQSPLRPPYTEYRSNHTARSLQAREAILRTPRSPYDCPSHGETPDSQCKARRDALDGLRSSFFRSGLIVRTPETLAELMKFDVADVVYALLEDACRLRRSSRARHSVALEAVQQARLNAARARCESLVQGNAKVLGNILEAEERQQAYLQDRNRYTESVALRMRQKSSPTLLRSLAPSKTHSSQADAATVFKGLPWTPPGKTSHSYHSLHHAKQTISPIAYPDPTCHQRSLVPTWGSRLAKQSGSTPASKAQSLRAGNVLSDDRFDADSLYRSSFSTTAEWRVVAGGAGRH